MLDLLLLSEGEGLVASTYVYLIVEGIEAILATVLGVKTKLALAKLLTLYGPPAQVQVVCQATVVPLAESRPVH